jgi:hypothetical protein
MTGRRLLTCLVARREGARKDEEVSSLEVYEV